MNINRGLIKMYQQICATSNAIFEQNWKRCEAKSLADLFPRKLRIDIC